MVTLPADVVEALRVQRGDTVLDLGCGTGAYLVALHARRPGVTVGLDISEKNLAESRNRFAGTATFGRTALVCADARRLPYGDGSFDRVVCSLVLYLLPLNEGLAELHRVLKPGGTAYVRVPMLGWGRAASVCGEGLGPRERVYRAGHVVNGLWFAIVGRQMRNPLMRHDPWAQYVPQSRFREAVRRVGFEVERLDVTYPRPCVASIDAWIVKLRRAAAERRTWN